MLYDRLFTNIVGFIDDIQIMTFEEAIMKDDRLFLFGIFLILLGILLIPLFKF
jgi:hypothetical protein